MLTILDNTFHEISALVELLSSVITLKVQAKLLYKRVRYSQKHYEQKVMKHLLHYG